MANSSPNQRRSYEATYQALVDLKAENDEDLHAGRMTQSEYDDCLVRINQAVAELNAPAKPGEIKVVGIPRKRIDIEGLAATLYQQAAREIAIKNGRAPISPKHSRQLAALARIHNRDKAKKKPKAEDEKAA